LKQLLILLTVIVSLSVVMSAYAADVPGEPSHGYQYVNHKQVWYDERQQHAIYGPPEPVYYPSFYFEPLGTVQCDNWIRVEGIVPTNGILYFTIMSGDYIGFHNVSHSKTGYLVNYFWLPCTDAEDGALLATFMYHGDDSPYPVKAKNESLVRPTFQIEIPFYVVGN